MFCFSCCEIYRRILHIWQTLAKYIQFLPMLLKFVVPVLWSALINNYPPPLTNNFNLVVNCAIKRQILNTIQNEIQSFVYMLWNYYPMPLRFVRGYNLISTFSVSKSSLFSSLGNCYRQHLLGYIIVCNKWKYSFMKHRIFEKIGRYIGHQCLGTCSKCVMWNRLPLICCIT